MAPAYIIVFWLTYKNKSKWQTVGLDNVYVVSPLAIGKCATISFIAVATFWKCSIRHVRLSVRPEQNINNITDSDSDEMLQAYLKKFLIDCVWISKIGPPFPRNLEGQNLEC